MAALGHRSRTLAQLNNSLNKPALAFLFYTGLFGVLLSTFLGRLTTAVFGKAGDALGVVWAFWWWDFAASKGLDRNLVSATAFPFGLDWQTMPLQSQLWDVAARAFHSLGNEIFRFNLLVLAAFPLSATAAFVAAHRLNLSFWPSAVAGLAFGFSPYIWAHSYGHMGLAHAEFLPVLFLLTVSLIAQSLWWRVLALGSTLGLIFLVHFYYGYIGAVLIATVAGASWLGRRRFTPKAALGARPLLSVGAAVIMALVLLSPFIVPVIRVLLDPSLRSTLGPLGYVRPAWEFAVYAAQPWQYLMPPPDHVLFGPLVRGFWEAQDLPGDTEFRLYVGIVPLLLAAGALSSAATRALSPERRLLRFVVTAVLAVAFFFSFAPRLWPLDAILSSLLPMFRVYARFGVGVILAVSLLAAFGLEHLLQRLNGRWRPAVAIGIIALSLVDLVPSQPLKTYDANLPEPYTWLATLDPKTVLAEYPFLDDWSSVHSQYLFAQRVHQKALVNGSVSGTPLFALHETLQDLVDPETPARLATLGVDYILVHEDFYTSEKYLNAEPPDLDGNPAFALVRSADSLKVYRLLAKPIGLAQEVTFEGGLRLLNAQSFVSAVSPETTVTVAITLDLPPNLPPDHGLFVHLNDVEEQTVAQANIALPPLHAWPPKLVTHEPGVTFDLPISLPGGIERERLAYRIGITDSSLRNLVITDGRPDLVGRREVAAAGDLVVRGREAPPPSTHPVSVQFADGLQLLGFDSPKGDRAAQTVQLGTTWAKQLKGDRAYVQFYHVLDEAGHLVAQQDQRHKHGRYPTSVWAIGEVVPERVDISLPPGLAPGAYRIAVGLYDGSTGERLPVLTSSLPTSQNSVILGSFSRP